MKKKVAITTLGCKVNQYESASFVSGLQEKEAELVPFSHKADVYIINTCAVTARAGAQSRQLIRRALRTNPDARLVVTGCYAQIAPLEILDSSGLSTCIVGNGNKHRLVDIVMSDRHCDLEMHMGDIGEKKEICPLPVKRFPGRTRAYLKLQDGCNNFCSYCIVPYARGRSRSLSVDQVLEQVKVFTEEGYKEIVLTGIHVGMYGQDLSPEIDFLEILRRIVESAPSVRFRLSSLEPGEVSEDLLRLISSYDNFMPHLHIPLQSGDSEILKKMNRRYPPSHFTDTVKKIVHYMPEAAIGVDVLVGFPGEDDNAFLNTLNIIKNLPVTYLHVFPYSRRPGTVAASMKNHVAGSIKDERVSLLRLLDQEKRAAFYSRHIGEIRSVLAESKKNTLQLMRGFTDNYIPVYFNAPDRVTNQVVNVRIKRIEDGNVFGELVEK
ncbi:MAG: tRNA (N(6)-L-threonylcarbamoyladenosine(37)-C(2))-methylthiotransferase MtaB [Desulfobulbaceae bacterium]|uniref:tRNA (N(6)-L-threonylcarbamoyladenosine(37)-C(2))-methylthiotransferase n=1 Tax=Candidatus Desulfobia pelagia TaxID=2841692 RepID=A0A8J6N8V0_9BACT|nr:tRNA (N(6)-L-threonylcarbamoyladenosine(37)-C(2))-methylthiotransferase MtaB [Candidatus Desulfobia pelagia]